MPTAAYKSHNAKEIWQFINQISCLEGYTNYEYGGLTGEYQASITHTQAESNMLIYREKGTWTGANQQRFKTTNRYRWSLYNDHLELEHLRCESAVFLARFIDIGNGIFVSQQPHQCRKDFYSAKLILNKKSLQLSWQISGDTKKGVITVKYL